MGDLIASRPPTIGTLHGLSHYLVGSVYARYRGRLHAETVHVAGHDEARRQVLRKRFVRRRIERIGPELLSQNLPFGEVLVEFPILLEIDLGEYLVIAIEAPCNIDDGNRVVEDMQRMRCILRANLSPEKIARELRSLALSSSGKPESPPRRLAVM